jgi:sulfopyruvate decarboxylase alpha subunit
MTEPDQQVHSWQHDILASFLEAEVSQVAYVPDAGHKGLIRLCEAEPSMTMTVLTTEEEGIGLATGAWLGGRRAALLMQSSGVGNCPNILTLAENCRIPLLMLITMRGEWAEFVPWQAPMGRRTPAMMELMGCDVIRIDHPEQMRLEVSAAADHAFLAQRPVAVILSQRLIGRKDWKVAQKVDHE